jgi:hypothetical protein
MSIAAINAEVEARTRTPEAMNLVLVRAIDRITLAHIKRINLVVGRAANTMTDHQASPYAKDIPDYQKYLMEYVRLKRQLGLFRRNLINEEVTEAALGSIRERIHELTLQVRDAREVARRFRFGQFSAKALSGRLWQ